MARPRWHLLTTLPLAAYAAQKWGTPAALGAVCSGLLIDADHLVDYAWTRARGARSHYIAPLHGWELALGLGLLARRAVRRARRRRVADTWLRRDPLWTGGAAAAALVGLTAGMVVHLAVDVMGNRPKHAGVYSLLYRFRHGFSREATGWTEEGGFHSWSALPWHQWWRAL